MKVLKKLVVVGLAVFIACGHLTEDKRIINGNFPKTTSLKLEEIKISETLKAQAIILLEDFLVVQNDYIAGEDCFFVYTRDKVKFCYSFGKLGQSGRYDEFIAPRLIQNNTGNIVAIFDQATRKINYYSITPNKFTLVEQNKIYDGSKFPLQEISFVNDSILLFLSYNSAEICSYNLASKTIIDKKTFQTDIKEKTKSSYNPNFEAFQFCNKGKQIAIGFQFVNKILVGSLDNSYRFIFNTDKIKSDMRVGKDNFYANKIYYMCMLPSSRYLFAQYLGLPFQVLQPFPLNKGKRNFNFLMEAYDWKLNKKILIDFKHDVLRFTVDEKNKCMYTWNPLADFDYLLKYSFDTLD